MRERRLRAIATMIAAVAVFSFMDGFLKLLAAYYRVDPVKWFADN